MIRRNEIDPAAIDWDAVDEEMRRAVQWAVWEHKQLGYPITLLDTEGNTIAETAGQPASAPK